MIIDLKKIPIKKVFEGYIDDAENGVRGYGGKLNIRPAFQREFIYKAEQRDEVIRTVKKGFPLNVMYWVKDGNGNYELLDGQQRTISICQYLDNDYSVDFHKFSGLTNSERKQIEDYELMIYICEGTDKEKIEWFDVINIAGEKLNRQERRNAIYAGEWLTDAKRYFSRKNSAAKGLADKYMSLKVERQEYLEKALQWISDRDGIKLEEYMCNHQTESNANDLWLYFNSVINWAKTIFPKTREAMKGVEWGILYNRFKDASLDPRALETKIAALMVDEEISNESGIYQYVLDGDEKSLNLRAFDKKQKRIMYEKQQGICANCKKHFRLDEMEADHIVPWSRGGKTNLDNGQMLCRKCNNDKRDR